MFTLKRKRGTVELSDMAVGGKPVHRSTSPSLVAVICAGSFADQVLQFRAERHRKTVFFNLMPLMWHHWLLSRVTP